MTVSLFREGSAARCAHNLPAKAGKFHTCGLSGVFSDAHAPGRLLLPRCGNSLSVVRKTIRIYLPPAGAEELGSLIAATCARRSTLLAQRVSSRRRGTERSEKASKGRPWPDFCVVHKLFTLPPIDNGKCRWYTAFSTQGKGVLKLRKERGVWT